MIEYQLTQSGHQIQNDLNLVENLQPAFSTYSIYQIGDLVTYNGALYKCTQNISIPGPWTGAVNWIPIHLNNITPSDIPTPTVSDAGKSLIVDEYGNYTLQRITGGTDISVLSPAGGFSSNRIEVRAAAVTEGAAGAITIS